MSNPWRVLIFVVAAIIVAGIGYWLFHHYQNIKKPHVPAIEAITQDVVCFIQSDDVRAAVYKLITETEYWPELMTDSLLEQFQVRFEYLDSLFSDDPGFNEVLELKRFTLAYSKGQEGGHQFVYLMELPAGEFVHTVESFIKETIGVQSIVMKRDYGSAVIQTVNLTGPEALFYFSVYKGLLIGSFDESLVQASINQLDDKRELPQLENFKMVHSTAGKNVEANIYIHIPNFMDWAGQHLMGEYQAIGSTLRDLAYWSEIDLLVNNDDLLFNGYTISQDTAGTLLDRFRHSPQPIRVEEILPFNVSWMMHWGIANFKTFLLASKDQAVVESLLKGYDRDFGVDIENDFLSWIGHEAVLTAFPRNEGGQASLIVLHSTDIVKAVLSLGTIEQKVNKKNKTVPYLLSHKDYNIRKLGLNRLFMDFVGSSFPVLDGCYYVTLKDYLLFSDNPQDLVHVIDHFYNQKTLLDDENYQAFSDNISDRSNIYIYANLKNPDPKLNEIVSSASGIRFLDGLKQFEGFALQFSFINQMFYTNMFLSYNPEYRETNGSNRETELEANVAVSPFLVKNHRNGKTNIIVFDEKNTMVLIDHIGRIQWQLPLIEAPISEVFVVDYYGNKKYQYLFNTRNYIYLVDLNGNYVADYPVKLLAPATNGMAVFDYDEDENYRLMLALEDNKIHNYTLEFSAIDGWTKIQAGGRVRNTVQYLEKGGKDYLFVADEKGHLSITDRKGQARIAVRKKINKAINADFYVNRTNSKGDFLTSDTKGDVVYISEQGKINHTDFGKFSSDHHFFYADFNADDHQDFIFIDGNRMVVFNRFKKVILEQQFDEVITQDPVLFSLAGRVYVGVVLDVKGEILLFDHQGQRFQDQYLEGSMPFVVGNLDEGHLNLITAKGSTVLNYQLN